MVNKTKIKNNGQSSLFELLFYSVHDKECANNVIKIIDLLVKHQANIFYEDKTLGIRNAFDALEQNSIIPDPCKATILKRLNEIKQEKMLDSTTPTLEGFSF